MKDKRLYNVVDMLDNIRDILWTMKQDNVIIELEDRQFIKEQAIDLVNDIVMYNKPIEEVKKWLEDGKRKPWTRRLD